MLHTLPQVGQLLGRLVSLPALMMDLPLHKALLHCLMVFYREQPQGDVEKRAKAWVLVSTFNWIGLYMTKM